MVADKVVSRVRLNVGGRMFETTRDVLTKHKPSLLAKLVAMDNRTDDALFVDADGDMFVHILTWLRRDLVPCGLSATDSARLLAEVLFFELHELAQALLAAAPPNLVSQPANNAANSFDETLQMRIDVFTLDELHTVHKGLDMFPQRKAALQLVAKRRDMLASLKLEIAARLGLPADQFRLWPAV